jgi:hypothetical protein
MMGQLLKSNPGRFVPNPVRPYSRSPRIVSHSFIKDRPFNLQEGGYGFLLRSEFFFRPPRVRIKKNCRAKREFFFLEFNIRLYDKNSESDYFFFPPPKTEYFFRKKNITLPFKLNCPSLISALKNEIWKTPLQIFVFWML